jgi:hypothetical protein
MNKNKTAEAKTRNCVFCKEPAFFVRDYQDQKEPAIALHDTCKPFHTLYLKLRRK